MTNQTGCDVSVFQLSDMPCHPASRLPWMTSTSNTPSGKRKSACWGFTSSSVYAIFTQLFLMPLFSEWVRWWTSRQRSTEPSTAAWRSNKLCSALTFYWFMFDIQDTPRLTLESFLISLSNAVAFVRIMHLKDNQHIWGVRNVPWNMWQISLLLKNSFIICWYWSEIMDHAVGQHLHHWKNKAFHHLRPSQCF